MYVQRVKLKYDILAPSLTRINSIGRVLAEYWQSGNRNTGEGGRPLQWLRRMPVTPELASFCIQVSKKCFPCPRVLSKIRYFPDYVIAYLKHSITHCWFNVVPLSTTLARH